MAIVHDGNTNYASNAKANAALTTGIIGTSGFGLGLLNSLTNGMGLFNNNCAKAVPVCSEDHLINRYEAAQAAKIAELETEVKLRDANTYTDQKLLEVYKYFDGFIHKSLSFASSKKLLKASITNVIEHLSVTASGQTVTFTQIAVNNAFETTAGAGDGSTSAEWQSLIAPKSNWTISLV